MQYDRYGIFLFFFFKQKTAYELRISDWSSDVCSSDLEILGEKRSQWLIFPGLDIACGPVVEQAKPGNMIGRLIDRNRGAKIIPGAYPYAHLQLIVQPLAGGQDGRIGIGSPDQIGRAHA